MQSRFLDFHAPRTGALLNEKMRVAAPAVLSEEMAASKGTAAPVAIRHLIEAGGPAAVVADPLFASGLQDSGDIVPLIVHAPSRRFMVPETTFTVDTRVPDLVSTTIRAPER